MDNTQLIISMYQNKVSILKISKILGISEFDVYDCLYEHGFSHMRDRDYAKDKEICNRYLAGEKIIDIANSYQVDRHSVTDILRRHKVYKNFYADCRSSEKIDRTNKMIELYKSGLSLSQVAKEVGTCASTVAKTLNKMGIDTRPQHMLGHSKGTTKNRKYHFNINFFEEIDTEEKAYWLGFLYADGYVAYRGVTSVALKEDDRCHLEAFRKALGDENVKIDYYRTTKSYRIDLSSVKMSEDLVKLGCKQKKSLILTFPTEKQVPKKLLSHFMRGYFDGDGCISGTRYSLQFSVLGTPSFLDKYENVLLRNLKNKKKTKRIMRENWNSNTQQIIYGGRLRLLDIYNFLYKDATIFLNRKKEKFEELIRRPGDELVEIPG